MNPFDNAGYRYATIRIPGDGSTVDHNFSFSGGYIDSNTIQVAVAYIDGVETIWLRSLQWNLIGPSQIRLVTPVPVSSTLVIRRVTTVDEPLVDFTDGAILNEQNLNKSVRQAILSNAELADRIADLLAQITP